MAIVITKSEHIIIILYIYSYVAFDLLLIVTGFTKTVLNHTLGNLKITNLKQ